MRKLQAGLLGLAAAVMMTILPSGAYAYTESEKRRAKAWLSSHGYPATKAGAYQAYDDWMNGKWWDEFGPPEGMGEDDDDDETKATAVTQKDRDADEESKKQKGELEKPGGDSDSGKPSEDANRIVDAIAESRGQVETSSLADTDEKTGVEDTSAAEVNLEDMPSIMSIFVTSGSGEDVSPVTQRAEESTTEDEKEIQGNYIPTIFGGMLVLAFILILVLRKKKD